jgi:hypothetical protein
MNPFIFFLARNTAGVKKSESIHFVCAMPARTSSPRSCAAFPRRAPHGGRAPAALTRPRMVTK